MRLQLDTTTEREFVDVALKLGLPVPVVRRLFFQVYLVVTQRLDPLERLEPSTR